MPSQLSPLGGILGSGDMIRTSEISGCLDIYEMLQPVLVVFTSSDTMYTRRKGYY